MRHRLNVTEQERLCYSRRKLQAISALRSSGVNPSLFGLHKDYRVPGLRGKVYLVEHPNGDIYHFASLKEIHLYVAEYEAWQAQSAFAWDEWRYAPAHRATWRHMLSRPGRARLRCFPA